MAGSRKANGFKTDRGRLTIVGAQTSHGAECFIPVVPGEREEDWLALLKGVRERIGPTDRLEEEMVYNLAMALWQARRLHRYEKAATHQHIEDAAKFGAILGSGSDAMSRLLARGVESLEAELGAMERVLGLVSALGFAHDEEFLERAAGAPQSRAPIPVLPIHPGGVLQAYVDRFLGHPVDPGPPEHAPVPRQRPAFLTREPV
jgi:hypothetical protein